MDLIGKKLLILGGTNMSCEIVQKAKELGLYVIVADYDENAPAKIIADKASMVSATDVDAVVNLIKEEGIDGILTGFIELLLPFYQQICEKARLPCYATKEQIEIATNKIKFKQLCRDFNIPVVEEFQINLTISKINCQNISYPVLIKPIDNTAGRGISTCSNFDELTKNFEKSLSYSPSKTVIVEKYMPWKEATIFYTAQDGNIFLTAIADRHTQNPACPCSPNSESPDTDYQKDHRRPKSRRSYHKRYRPSSLSPPCPEERRYFFHSEPSLPVAPPRTVSQEASPLQDSSSPTTKPLHLAVGHTRRESSQPN